MARLDPPLAPTAPASWLPGLASKLFQALYWLLWRLNCQLKTWRANGQFFALRHWFSQTNPWTQDPIVVVAPHPDDEVFGCGGLIALKRSQGIPVNVIFLTDGGASHSGLVEMERQTLVTTRHREALNALSILGVGAEQVHFLNYPDGELANLPAEQTQAAIAQLQQRLQACQPGAVYVTHAGDRSSDHEVAYRWVKQTIDSWHSEPETRPQPLLYEYPIWILWDGIVGLNFPVQVLQGAYRQSIASVQRQKQTAIAQYQSQCSPVAKGQRPVLPPGFTDRFQSDHEIFFKR
ncbi:MAG: PIG-L family deacetylase [Synechococcales bacterium]|nr:PIG-L family deacetylase [Synechococcales bacterium]